MIKASDETLAALGVQGQADVIPAILAKFTALSETIGNLSAGVDALKAKIDAAVSADDYLKLSESVDSLKASIKEIKPVDNAALIAAAKEAGSLAAATALGSVGVNAVQPAANSEPQAVDNAEKLIAEGKFEDAYNASESLKAEFSSAKVYAAYMRATAGNKVSIFTK